MLEEDLKKLCRRVAKDLGLIPKRIDDYCKNCSGLNFADRLAREAFLLDRNMDSVRELRAYLIDLEEQVGIREPHTWDEN